MGRNNRNNQNAGGIPSDVRDFVEMTVDKELKLWKKDKKHGLTSMSKKDVIESLYGALFDMSPIVIDWTLKHSHIQKQEIQDLVDGIYGKFVDDRFLKYATRIVKEEGVSAVPEYRVFPLIASTLIKQINEVNNKRKTEGQALLDTEGLETLCTYCFKKKLKKLIKLGVDKRVAYAVLMAYPHKSCLEYGKTYRIRVFFDTLYSLSKTVDVPFDLIMKALVPEEQWPAFVGFALLEKKNRHTSIDVQKLFNVITKWCLDYLEGSSDEEIRMILTLYINNRKKDVERDNDGARRFPLSSLSKDEYPNICRAMQAILSANPANKEYLD